MPIDTEKDFLRVCDPSQTQKLLRDLAVELFDAFHPESVTVRTARGGKTYLPPPASVMQKLSAIVSAALAAAVGGGKYA